MYNDDKLHEECGVFGIYAPGNDVARNTFFALYALQHRGQEAAGIVTSDGHVAHVHKGMGLVSQVFNEDNLRHLRGHLAIGHTRYSTTGAPKLRNTQPYIVETLDPPRSLPRRVAASPLHPKLLQQLPRPLPSLPLNLAPSSKVKNPLVKELPKSTRRSRRTLILIFSTPSQETSVLEMQFPPSVILLAMLNGPSMSRCNASDKFC